jgi:hypothetical protein
LTPLRLVCGREQKLFVCIVVRKGAVPVGAVLAALETLAAIIIRVLNLDRVPVTLCSFRAITGMPCMSCGSTRALARLAAFDPLAALRIQPLFTVLMLGVIVFGLADLAVFVAKRKVLSIQCTRSSFKWLAVIVVVLILANWIYLLLGASMS